MTAQELKAPFPYFGGKSRAVLEAAPQPPTIKECLTDELKPRFSAHDDAERLKSVARGMSYNDHGEAVWKHTLMEIAVRLESGGYAAPQPPALEQQVEKESTCKDSLQVEQEPVAWYWIGRKGWVEYGATKHDLYDCKPLYAHPQPRQPLTDEQIAFCIFEARLGAEGALKRSGSSSYRIARAIEAAHNIK